MESRELDIGDVCQIRPDYEQFGGMLLVVTEPKKWGAQGYLMSCHHFDAVKFRGIAYLRVKWEEMEYVGKLEWILADGEPNE